MVYLTAGAPASSFWPFDEAQTTFKIYGMAISRCTSANML